MKAKHILFVEDELEQRDLFRTAIEDYNRLNTEANRAFGYTFATNVEEAEASLDQLRFDGALFDLRVKRKGGGRAELAGNALATTALEEHGIPVAIMTANTSMVAAELEAFETVKVFDKNGHHDKDGDAYGQAIAWFSRQWDMMDVLDASRRIMERSAADIFLKRLWPRWKMFETLDTGSRDELIKIVTRQYVSHVAEYLGLDDPDNASWHPFENFVSPSLSDLPHTGDIFKLEDGLFVVLTPQCDMATENVDNVLLVKCVQGSTKWQEAVKALRAADNDNKRERATKTLRDFVNQNIGQAKHFLPPLPGESEPLLVDFSFVKTMPRIELKLRLKDRIASISAPFLANIVQRFGAYISRTGQPNIDVNRF